MHAPNFKDLSGKVYGRLTVLSRIGRDRRGNARWLTSCSCGKKHEVSSNELRCGSTKSCGCLKAQNTIERNWRHGGSNSREYRIWSGAKNRCHNPSNKSFYQYGARGIVMCLRWRESFENFLEDMGSCPFPKSSIDRINTLGNYELKNCRWATPKQQSNNQRTNHLITWEGLTMNVSQWAEYLGMRYSTLSLRIQRGWSIERALTPLV